jgi:hypothetical protein
MRFSARLDGGYPPALASAKIAGANAEQVLRIKPGIPEPEA